jgi:DNA helicase-2/ATP-dependent DNA helicase PcrA
MSRDYVVRPFRPPIDLRIDYERELNPQQKEAATAPPGPALVIAGAGSGKTRTLVYRVAFLLEQGITPDRILLLTFTNKAAKEMMGRVADLLGSEPADLWGGTFHSVGARILRQHAALVGYEPDFTILDREDSSELIKACVQLAGIEAKGTDFPKPEALAEVFSMASNKRISAGDLLASEYGHLEAWAGEIQTLHQAYERRKRETNGMDFDDLLLLWLRLLRENPEAREHYQRRFQFVLVDEYQDTNALQCELIDLLVERHKNVMVVGDDAQSIYSWRGADFNNILEFPKRYPGARVFKIETNYRSTPEILVCANAVIATNTRQFAKTLVSSRASGPKPVVAACEGSAQQADFIAQRIGDLSGEGVALSGMAVLYRSHFHALELQLELTRRQIPFTITSGIRFFEQAHIKDVTSYLKLLANPRDEISFKRVAALLPGIGAKSAAKLWGVFSAEWARRGASAPTGSENPRPVLAPVFAVCGKSVPAKAAAAWAALSATISQLEAPALRGRPSKMIARIIEGGYDRVLEEHYDRHKARREDLDQLADFATQFGNLDDFLTQLALFSSLEAEDNSNKELPSESVRLSTVHQAKGLEFDVVFIIMLCDELFPSARSLESPGGEEEERRLFYVAVTRAKTHLYLTWPQMRFSYGSNDFMQRPSRFLAEIPKGSTEVWNLRRSYHD